MAGASPCDLYGLVDIESDGIRCSINDLSGATARSLPMLFYKRLNVSLHDTQHSTSTKEPLSQAVINRVIHELRIFEATCADFRVPGINIHILATDAARNALNFQDLCLQIKNATGLIVKMLTQTEEGRLRAYGVASSSDMMDGLVMDLGGGSTQLTWIIFEDGYLTISPKTSVSFPYGAASMSQMLSEIDAEEKPQDRRMHLQRKIIQEYKDALTSLELPNALDVQVKNGQLTLYLTGSGFEGWGYILMSIAKKGPYPIPYINGYHTSFEAFGETDRVERTATEKTEIFRVTKRRASQVPAVAFLVSAIMGAFPFIEVVRFCSGGVREGFLFDKLSPGVKCLSPLSSATSRFAVDPDSAAYISDLIGAALPINGDSMHQQYPASLTKSLIRAVADIMYVQGTAQKDSASLSALHTPITGILAGVYGLSHSDRAILALILCERWYGGLPPPHDDIKLRLESLISMREVWWCRYLGTIARFIGDAYPSGRVQPQPTPRIQMDCRWTDERNDRRSRKSLVLTVRAKKGGIIGDSDAQNLLDAIKQLGKKKNKAGGKQFRFDIPIRVSLVWT